MFRHGEKAIRIFKSICATNSQGFILKLPWVSLGFGQHMICHADCHHWTLSITVWQVSTSLARYHQEAGYVKQLLVAENKDAFKEYKVVSLLLFSFLSPGISSEKTRITSFNKVRKEITLLQQVVSCTSQPRLSSTLSQKAARNLND